MKTLVKILLIIFVNLSLFSHFSYAAGTDNLQIGVNNGVNSINNAPLEELRNVKTDFTVEKGGQEGIYNGLIRFARDLKNLFFIISGLYFLILVIRLLFSEKTDEEVSTFKKGIVWISIGIIVTQISYYFVNILFDKQINTTLAKNFIDIIVQPFINLLSVAASFVFLAMMIFAFYKIVTSNGDEEAAKSGKMSVLYAAIGFIVIKVANKLVETVYGKTYCFSHICENRVKETDLTGAIKIITDIINWMNGFIGLVVVIMIIYAGFLTLMSAGDEEKFTKAKNIIVYVAIGLLVLFANYLILTFFIVDPTTGTSPII